MVTALLYRSIVFMILLLLAVCPPSSMFAQYDDPLRDNTLGLIPPVAGPGLPNAIAVVTDPGGYDNFDLGVDFSEPHMVSNPRVPYQYFNAWNTNGTHYTTTDGYTWSTQSPVFGATMRGDPVMAYDSLGNLYYENMYGSPSILGCKIIKSTNNGQTWSAAVTSIAGVDKNWIAADQTMGPYANYVYTTMTASSGGNFARSTDQGATWTTTRNFTEQALPGMMVCVGSNMLSGNNISGGCVYVVTNSGSAFGATYTFHVSTDGGATFTQKSAQSFANYVGTNVSGRNSVQNMRTRPYPFITADNSFGAYRGRLYLVYASNNPSGDGNRPDIYSRYSTDQGATWSTAVTVNDDASSTNNHQWSPATWCDKQTGRLYVKWYDTRNCPTHDSTDVYASYSDNGGVTFVANQILTTQKFKIDCSTCGGGGTPRYQGDYDAITSNQYVGMAVWGDFRSGNFGSYAAYFPDFAMTTTPTSLVTLASNDSADIRVRVPSVKLYTNGVKFTASYSPAGTMTFSFVGGRDSLANSPSAYPDSVTLRLKGNSTPEGNYSLVITGAGPNGTPIHKRTITVNVTAPLPVQLASFTASVVNRHQVRLDWMTISEVNNYGFEVQKSITREGDYQTIAGSFVPGHGTTLEPQYYTFTDTEAGQGNWFYRLKQIDLDGTLHYCDAIHVALPTDVAAQTDANPRSYKLEQNYPNPFNPVTTFQFSIVNHELTILKVYDVFGQEVATLVKEEKPPGVYTVRWDADGVASGVYFCRLKAGSFVQTRKMLLVR